MDSTPLGPSSVTWQDKMTKVLREIPELSQRGLEKALMSFRRPEAMRDVAEAGAIVNTGGTRSPAWHVAE